MAVKSLEVIRATSSKLAFCLYLQRMKKIFCDIKLNIGNTVCIHLHSCVLASFSPCLDSLVKSVQNGEIRKDSENSSSILNWSFQSPLELTLSPENASSSKDNLECEECALKFFDFLYLGKLKIEDHHVSHIEYLSKILQINELLLECENYRKVNNGEKVEDKQGPNINASCALKDNIQDSERNVIYKKQINIGSSMSDETSHYLEVLEHIKEEPSSTVGNVNSQKSILDKVPDVSSKDSSTIYQCNACTYFTKSHYDLLTHMLLSNHKKKICSLCMFEADSSKSLSVHILLHNDPKPFFCSFCSARFETKSDLEIHSNSHPNYCSSCHTLFQSDHELKNHMATHYTEKYTCDKCGFFTTNNNELKSHILHGTEMFECPQKDCMYKTHFKCCFGDHILIHNSKLPYLCEVCGETFPKEEDLNEHTHSKPMTHFSCPMCNFQTALINKLEDHLSNSHPNFKCKIVKIKNDLLPNKSMTSTNKNVEVINNVVPSTTAISTIPQHNAKASTTTFFLKNKVSSNTFVLPISSLKIDKTCNKPRIKEKIQLSDQIVALEDVSSNSLCSTQKLNVVSTPNENPLHVLDSGSSKSSDPQTHEDAEKEIITITDPKKLKTEERVPPLKRRRK